MNKKKVSVVGLLALVFIVLCIFLSTSLLSINSTNEKYYHSMDNTGIKTKEVSSVDDKIYLQPFNGDKVQNNQPEQGNVVNSEIVTPNVPNLPNTTTPPSIPQQNNNNYNHHNHYYGDDCDDYYDDDRFDYDDRYDDDRFDYDDDCH